MHPIANVQMDLMFIILLILILLHANKSKYVPDRLELRLYNLHLLAIMLAVVLEAVSWLIEGNARPGLDGLKYVIDLVGFLTDPLPALTWMLYVHRRTGGSFQVSLRLKLFFFVPLAVNTALCLTNHWTHWYFIEDTAWNYQRGIGYISIYVFIFYYVAWAAVLAVRAVRRPELSPVDGRNIRLMIIYPLAPLLGSVFQILIPGISTVTMGVMIAVCICYIYETLYRLERMHKLEMELDQSRVAIMMSQIKPHFLYNALVAIQELCHTDAELAAEAVGEFAVYLRGNLDSISETKRIPFSKELQHVENYLSLEKKRFEERLNVAYELHETEFSLPAMTLQPIVENAVRHGVTKKTEGGTILIRTERTDGAILITISDDGVGADFSKPNRDDRTHIGIDNVRSRLESLCGGTLRIDSAPGVGTVVLMTIPTPESAVHLP